MYKKLLVFLLIFLGIGVVIQNFQEKKTLKSPNEEEIIKEFKATLAVKEKSFDISQFIGKTALEATERVVKVVKSGEGKNAFVTEINEQKADTKNREFWEFLVNGKPASVGAGSYVIQNGDKLKWQLSLY